MIAHARPTTISTCNNLNNHKDRDNNMKHPSLKRVSFGSSKGSMVETLIYDHPLPEEDLSYYQSNITRYGTAGTVENDTNSKPLSKVRVTFFESQKPHYVTSPDSPDDLDLPIMATPSPTQEEDKPGYLRQESTESGRDNPFRPDGDLSKEADEIVGLIKEGKPIVGTPTRQEGDVTDNSVGDSPAHPVADGGPKSPVKETMKASKTNAVYANNAKGGGGLNGAAPTGTLTPEAIEVQRGIVVPANDAQVVEHVTIQKKPKCKCCEIM